MAKAPTRSPAGAVKPPPPPAPPPRAAERTPASVEERARAAAHEYAKRQTRTPAGHGLAILDHREGYLRGHADAASEDRVALERANGLLWDVMGRWVNGIPIPDATVNAIDAHLRTQEGIGTPDWTKTGQGHPALREREGRIPATKATASEIRETLGVSEDELRVGREAVKKR